jgi:DNA polymerase III alpha subunit
VETHRFLCGCSFPVLEPAPAPDILPLLDLSIDAVPLDCSATWELLGRGDTKGVFQLEKHLGQDHARRLRPEHMEHLAALGAILRPGALNSRDAEGISTTEHYCRRKNREEPIEGVHEAVDRILATTYSCLIFQEQFLRIARELAGFDPAMAYKLQKNIGKKNMALLMQLEQEFMQGCVRVGILPANVAELVWSWIKAAGRYAFNKAHAMSYAFPGYRMAYAKAHAPLQFFAAKMETAELRSDSREEIALLVEDARLHGISIRPPSFVFPLVSSGTDRRDIYLGFSDIKRVGTSKAEDIVAQLAACEKICGKPARDCSWLDILLLVLAELPRGIVPNLLESGACDNWGGTRSRKMAEFDVITRLKGAELTWVKRLHKLQRDPRSAEAIQQNCEHLAERIRELKKKRTKDSLCTQEESELEDSLATLDEDTDLLRMRLDRLGPCEHLEDLLLVLANPPYRKPTRKSDPEPTGPFGGCKLDRRPTILGLVDVLRTPPSPHVDSIRQVVLAEEAILGVTLTVDRLDQCDGAEANVTVSEFLAGYTSRRMLFAVEVIRLNRLVTKKGRTPGQEMARLSLRDRSGTLEAVCFPDSWQKCGSLLTEGAMVLVHGIADKKSLKPSLLVQEAWALR